MAGPEGDQPGCGWCADIADNKMLIHHLSVTYEHFTGGAISKPMTLPEEVFRVADDLRQREWEEDMVEENRAQDEETKAETKAAYEQGLSDGYQQGYSDAVGRTEEK